MASACPFCTPTPGVVFHNGSPLVLCLWDGYPVSPGHALVVTRRHVATWFDATLEERTAILRGIDIARAAILGRHSPSGFNIGVNVGTAAGQTVPHLHAHVIPRYEGDVPDPRGGVRGVIPHLASPETLADRPPPSTVRDGGALLEVALPTASRAVSASLQSETLAITPGPSLVGSDTVPFLPHLLADLAGCKHLDLAVAFILPSGLDRIWPYLEDVLDRGGRVRLLTGDYLGVTDPSALRSLLDLAAVGESDSRQGTLWCRVFETTGGPGFHPKVYVIHERSAYVGSSNLTEHALVRGVETNFRVEPQRDPAGFAAVLREFDMLFQHPRARDLTEAWIEAYALRRVTIERPPHPGVPEDEPASPPEPHEIQAEALAALRESRTAGNSAGLVVLATGLGKTWLSAFDSASYGRVLFVAHREEILRQARETYRRIRPDARLGLFTGREKDREVDVLFASIQTLARRTHLDTFPKDHFHYVVVDEFHHAAAGTYRRLLAHFEPRFLLGLTATPERSDGQDLLALCMENLVYECDVLEGIRRRRLCPFHYFGVPDEVDYENIPWRNGRFDPNLLEHAVATATRAENALEQWRRFAGAGTRTLAFCVSTRHADFMCGHFRGAGVRAAAVHSDASTSDSRAASLQALEEGDLEVVFCVDMFNEGVDLPSVDGVLMLRPTESRVLWLQQVGRGLRHQEGKTLRIVDYVGNHRTFLGGILTLLPLAVDTPAEVAAALRRLERGELELPAGCEVTYDLEALNILRALVQPTRGREALRQWYEDFRDRNGERPTASEAWHAGYDPGLVRRTDGSWLGFVAGVGDLAPEAIAARDSSRAFLDALETTPMTRSYKMLLLSAWLAEGVFPEPIGIERLTAAVARLVRRAGPLQRDVGVAWQSPEGLRRLLESNPIEAFTGGKGTGGTSYFAYDGRTLRTTVRDAEAHAGPLRELVQELVDWRLAQYLARGGQDAMAEHFVANVSHGGGGNPMLFLPDRSKMPGLPEGPTTVLVEGEPLTARFVSVALNVVRREGSSDNLLPAILRRWFGTEVGGPGRGPDRVVFDWTEEGYRMEPVGSAGAGVAGDREGAGGPVLWQEYERERIPGLWGLPFQGNLWRQGYLERGRQIFLLVTLEKANLPKDHRYADRFLGPNRFEWQSQNRTTQKSKAGQNIRHHQERNLEVQLFVRRMPKTARGTATPFTYCGQLEFVRWEGEKPITVEWRLRVPVPERLWRGLGVATA